MLNRSENRQIVDLSSVETQTQCLADNDPDQAIEAEENYMVRFISIFYILIFLIVPEVLAFQAPSGTFMEPVYTFFIEQILGGVGIIIAILIICYGFYWILRTNVLMTIGCALAAAGIYFAEDMAALIGAIYPF